MGEVGRGGAHRGREPIKSVKIVWSRELCGRGARRRRSLEQELADRLWSTGHSGGVNGRIGRPGGAPGPGGAELGAPPDRLKPAVEGESRYGCGGDNYFYGLSSHALALSPYLGSSENSSRKETVGPSWSRVGSVLSGRTFQNVE